MDLGRRWLDVLLTPPNERGARGALPLWCPPARSTHPAHVRLPPPLFARPEMMMRQKEEGEETACSRSSGRWRWLCSRSRENESHLSFSCTFTTYMFVLGEHCVSVSASASFPLLPLFSAFPPSPPTAAGYWIPSRRRRRLLLRVFCSSPLQPRCPVPLSGPLT